MSEAAPTLSESLSLLRTRRFGTFWVASLLSNIGTWAQQVAEPWLILTLSGSSFLVGADNFALNAPVWVLTLVGGVLADRRDRGRVILGFQSIQALCPAAIMVLLFFGAVRPWHIIALSVVVGVTDALSMPAFQSIVPSIVEREQIGVGYALNSTQFSLSRILGPAIAGVLMVQVGVLACFGVSFLSYVPLVLVALWIFPRRRPAPATSTARSPFAGVGDILRQPTLRNALLVAISTSMLSYPLITFCPVLVREVFHADASRYGGALAAFGIGGLCGAALLLALEGNIERRWLSSGAGISFALIVVSAALAPSLSIVTLLLVAGGTAMTMSNTSVKTLLQVTAGDELRGQAASVFMLAMRGGAAAGNLLTGLSAELLGVRHALLINGVLAVGAHLLVARLWPSPSPVASSAT